MTLSFFKKNAVTNLSLSDLDDMNDLALTDPNMLDLLEKAYVYYLLKNPNKNDIYEGL
jgi:hypothetical protein